MTDQANDNNTSFQRSRWDKVVDFFGFLSEAANIGIVIQMISKWWPLIMIVGSGIFAHLAACTDPIIYCCKSLIRLARLIGRSCFGVQFEEEKNGIHPWQTTADIVSLAFFTLAVLAFTGLLVTGPVGVTVGWVLALSGLCVVGYFDYVHQEKMAFDKFKEKHNEAVTAAENYDKNPSLDTYNAMLQKRAVSNAHYKEYLNKRNSKQLYIGLLIGLAFLLICGSAAVFAPPALAPILFIASKIASGYLAAIAVGRFSNFVHGKLSKPAAEEATAIPTLAPAANLSPASNVIIQKRLTAGEAIAIKEKYDAYKNAKWFTGINRRFFSSTTSASALAILSDEDKTEADKMQAVNAYLNDSSNQGKALHSILTRTLSSR